MDEKPNSVSGSPFSSSAGYSVLGSPFSSLGFWKVALAWGCLFVFFFTPFVLFIFQTFHLGSTPPFVVEFKWVGEYLRTVSAVIISLAGFSTVEVFKK